MYAVGHLALGYLSGKASSKLLDVDVQIPLLFLVAVIPDVDLFIPILVHRGSTHSLLVSALPFIPLFFLYKRRVVPYFVALIQHPLMGDYLAGGGVRLFWPLTGQSYGLAIPIGSPINIAFEWVLFAVSILAMVEMGDLQMVFKLGLLKQAFIVVVAAVTFIFIIQTPLGFLNPHFIPYELIIPYSIYFTIFTAYAVRSLQAVWGSLKQRWKFRLDRGKKED